MTQDLSIVTLVLHASLVVQIVMVGLLLASLASWTVIFGKLFGLRKVRAGNDEFEREFWAGRNLNDLFADATKQAPRSAMERIFASGMREFFKLREKRVADTGALLDGARRAMRASFQRELDTIESHLSFLASVGSVSPYVGLFGTVWGIMHAFIGLSNLQQVTLASVAPGIAEALVATAIGLFAAIPAVIAYNRFAREIDRIAIQLESFIEEFSNILQRNAGAMPAAPRSTCRRRMPPRRLAPAHDQRDQHGPVHRRHAGAADHLHGDRAAHHHRRRRPAERRQEQGAARALRRDRGRRRRAAAPAGRRQGLGDAAPGRPRRPRDARCRRGNANTPVVISADRNVKYETVVKAMDVLQRAGVQRVGLSVKQGTP